MENIGQFSGFSLFGSGVDFNRIIYGIDEVWLCAVCVSVIYTTKVLYTHLALESTVIYWTDGMEQDSPMMRKTGGTGGRGALETKTHLQYETVQTVSLTNL